MNNSISEISAVASTEKASVKKSGQFSHVNTYARKISSMSGKQKQTKMAKKEIPQQWTVGDVTAEASRLDGHIAHVSNPLAPVLIKGVIPHELVILCDEMMKDAKQSNGKSARSDTHCLLSAVYSLPYKPEDYYEYKVECEKFISDALKFHAKHYGEVLSCVMHLDESHIHYHALSINPDARACIPGWKAKRETMKQELDKGASKKDALKEGNRAYKDAMRILQDEFYEEVGKENGMERFGPRRQRFQPGPDFHQFRDTQTRIKQEKEAEEHLRIATKLRSEAEDLSSFVQRENQILEERVELILSKPEFILNDEIKKERRKTKELQERVYDLEEQIVKKDSIIKQLTEKVSDLSKQLRDLAKKFLSYVTPK